MLYHSDEHRFQVTPYYHDETDELVAYDVIDWGGYEPGCIVATFHVATFLVPTVTPDDAAIDALAAAIRYRDCRNSVEYN